MVRAGFSEPRLRRSGTENLKAKRKATGKTDHLGTENGNISELQSTGMVPLDVERPRLAFISIQRTARNPVDHLLSGR